MFQKKILFTYCGKFFKFESKLDAFYYFFGKIPWHVNSQKLFFSITKEINGLPTPYLSNRRLLKINYNERYMSEISDSKCWKCNQLLEIKNFCCKSCGALQLPKKNINYFELLEISQMYNVDMEELTKNFRNKQMIFHPDKFANRSKEELEISETYSTLLNKAYSTLKDPVTRGFYLLDLQKFPVKTDKTDTILDQEFLLTIMEKNEELEHANSISKLLNLMKINDDLITTEIFRVKNAFQFNKLEEAKINLLKLNYYINLSKKMKELHNNFLTSKYT